MMTHIEHIENTYRSHREGSENNITLFNSQQTCYTTV